MRKTVIVLMIVFLSSVSSGVQSLSSILMLTIFLMIQMRLKPYYDPQLNAMETLSLFVIILTIYCGLYYQAAEGEPVMDNELVSWLIFLGVLIPSVIFSINWVRKMWIEILKVVIVKSTLVFRFLTCGSWNAADFKAKHMNFDESEEEDQEIDLKRKDA